MLIVLAVGTLITIDWFREFLQDTFALLSILFFEHLWISLITITFGYVVLRVGMSFTQNKADEKYSLEAEVKCLDGADEIQVELMREEVILVDPMDRVIGHASKKDSHLNSNIYGKNMLHRAFSVFIFDKAGRLLMQKRSPEKITFPDFYANSCCSHPLYVADEMEKDIGVKRAAHRKIEQELGISQEDIPLESMTFISRIHYKAKSNEIWGEHEVDHVLFCFPPKDVVPKPNPNEVAEAKYFTMEELDDFVQNASKHNVLISPWFYAIHSTFLKKWWQMAIDNQLDAISNDPVIHRIDEGTGNISNTNSKNAPNLKKQGAYGQVKTHKDSVLSQLMHPDEVVALMKMLINQKIIGKLSTNTHNSVSDNVHVNYCFKMLRKTSRSFALVIANLPIELKNAICMFYLTLRALDTIEDDMVNIADSKHKIMLLKSFHKQLNDLNLQIHGIGEGDERELISNMFHINHSLTTLPIKYQEIITDITKRMGDGMAEFVDKDMGQGTIEIKDYDLYCYYVAGLVGEGLTRLFVASTLEPDLQITPELISLSHSMGLFLQKVNIIRDYLEDYVEGRTFWPKEIYLKYVDNLGHLAESSYESQSLECLNDMIFNALQHIPDCMAYLKQIKNKDVFYFCAVPQLMAIATLSKLYNNTDVFSGVVKIRKGTAALLLSKAVDISNVEGIFANCLQEIDSKLYQMQHEQSINTTSPLVLKQMKQLQTIQDQVNANNVACGNYSNTLPLYYSNVIAVIMLLSSLGYLYVLQKKKNADGYNLPRLTDSMEVLLVAIVFGCCGFLLAFGFFPFVKYAECTNATKKNKVK